MGSICDGITRGPHLTMEERSKDHVPVLGFLANARGEIFMELVGPDGEIKQTAHCPENAICTNGMIVIAGNLDSGTDATSSLFASLGIGIDNTAPTTDDTDLSSETGTRVTGDRSASNNVFTLTANFASNNPAGAATIQEGAICNDSAGSPILARGTHVAINKGASDNINMTYNVTWA